MQSITHQYKLFSKELQLNFLGEFKMSSYDIRLKENMSETITLRILTKCKFKANAIYNRRRQHLC